MKSDLPKNFREGDELTASLIDDILQELWRWRHMTGMPPLHVSEADSNVPPVLSYFADPSQISQFFPGTTGGGFGAGSFASPAQVSTPATIYIREVSPDGWDTTTSISTSSAYSFYTTPITHDKNAWYWKSPLTGSYYIVTADC